MVFRLFLYGFLLTAALVPRVAMASQPPKTLRRDFQAAAYVAYGKFSWAKNHRGIHEYGSTFQPDLVLKNHPLLKTDAFEVDKRGDQGRHYLLFLDRNLDVLRAESASATTLKYFESILALQTPNEVDRLKFLFDSVHTEDWTIAEDVLQELSSASNLHLNLLAQRLPVERLRASLEADFTRNRRDYVTYCGGFPYHGLRASVLADLISRRLDPKDARLLKKLVNDERFYGQPGMLVSYIRLDPDAGMKTLLQWAQGKSSDPPHLYQKEVALQNAALLRKRLPTHCTREMQSLLNRTFLKATTAGAWFQELYSLQAWDQTNELLAFADAHPNLDEDTWNEILRFALRNPEPRAREFLVNQRRANPKRLASVEELLEMLEPRNAESER